jgi:uncharacterized protein YbgA (DUF1722 family)/uncharacterized protein YbbK (DUF523 family)
MGEIPEEFQATKEVRMKKSAQSSIEPLRLGISACLLGRKVRYDGGHQLDPFIVNTLGNYVQFVPVCPEVECGFGIPREPLRLVGDPRNPRLVTIRTNADFTSRMQSWAQQRVKEMESEELCGFIFKARSPSSGMERVKVYDEQGVPANIGVGMFARAFMEHFPLLPVEEEGRLHDMRLREHFIERIFVYQRWRGLRAQRLSVGSLVDFHTRHKLLILSHSTEHYRTMGALVAQGKGIAANKLFDRYQSLLMQALSLKATVKKHLNVLQHLIGYFKRDLSSDEKQEFMEILDHYRQGHLPLIVPITLVNHYVRRFTQPYIEEQYYLHPHPVELALRNHV